QGNLNRRQQRLDRDQAAHETKPSVGVGAPGRIDRRCCHRIADSTCGPAVQRAARARCAVPGYTSSLMSWEMMRNLVRDEWLILSILLAWSLGGLAVICERLYALWDIVPKSEAFNNRVIDALERGDIAKATALCEMSQVPIADVFERGLAVYGRTPEK